jgi:hypothetical protein
LAASKDDKFWKKHNRMAGTDYEFSDLFKDLFWKMTDFDSADRIGLEEVKKHPWLEGEIYSLEEIMNFLAQGLKNSQLLLVLRLILLVIHISYKYVYIISFIRNSKYPINFL